MKARKVRDWVPEIVYEDTDEGQLGNLPLIHVPGDQQMPRFLLIWEARETGDFEPGLSGEDVPVVDWELRQYAHMEVLKEGLTPAEYDRVRSVLGLKPLKEAVKEGQEISQRVRENVARQEMAASGKKM